MGNDMWGEVGTTAGEIYTKFVGQEKPTPVSTVKLKVRKDEVLINMALGWLAREGKVQVTQEGKILYIKITG